MGLKKAKQILKNNIELLASLLAGAFFVAIIIPYVVNFGASWSKSNETWGQFGDYIGGSLNPIFGLITLLVILFNTRIQRKEIESNKEMMLAHTNMLNRQLELMEQKAVEEFTFQLLDEVRADEYISKAKANQWEALLGIYILYSNENGEYEPNKGAYIERSKLAEEHFQSCVGITYGEFIHVVYPKMLALVVCTNKLPEQNRYFIMNLIKTRFGMGIIAALVQFSYVVARPEEYGELKKLYRLLQGAGERLIFSEKVYEDFLKWVSAEDAQSNMMKSRTLMTERLAQRRSKSAEG